MTEDQRWTVEHFSQANPVGQDQGSAPALLRRVADTIDALGPVKVQDVVFHAELAEDGRDWPTMTVYYNRE